MRGGTVVRRGVVVAVALLCVVVAGAAAEAQSWRLEDADVRILVPLKPGGAFEAKSSALGGELIPGGSKPLSLAGEISLDLQAIETGISLRDRHLRENYLEVAKGPGFDKAVLSQVVLADADGAGFRGATGFDGTLLLHGVRRPVSGKALIRTAGSGVHVDADFVLTLTDFGIEPPQYMGVGVSSKLAVRVSFDARQGRTGRP
jgi:YceI-like domain